MSKDNQRHYMNQRHALRFPVEVHRRRRVLIEQRIICVLVWIVGLLLAWPMIVTDKYVDSTRYNEAEYIESVDAGIWILAIFLQVAWITGLLLITMRLTTNGS